MQFAQLKRREFITLLGGAVTWPLAARAQQPESMRRIGVMMGLREDDRLGQQQAQALRTGLQELGWTDARNIRIDFHWGLGEPGRAQSVAKELVALQPDLIVSHSVLVSIVVFRTTKTIPIVFVNVADPIGSGLVSSYSRPGGNITGFTNFEPTMGGKWVEVLKDLDSRVRRVAILFNPETAAGGGEYFLPSFRAACAALGLEPIEAPVHDGNEIKLAIDALAREPNGGLVAMADIYTGLTAN